MRELAGDDPERFREVLKWKVGDALAAYEKRLREQAQRRYEIELQVWSTLAATGATRKRRPPEPPLILKG